jgi:hypothetical protein
LIEQIVAVLKQVELGMPIADVIRQLSIHQWPTSGRVQNHRHNDSNTKHS